MGGLCEVLFRCHGVHTGFLKDWFSRPVVERGLYTARISHKPTFIFFKIRNVSQKIKVSL
jgi:hypothetical protein